MKTTTNTVHLVYDNIISNLTTIKNKLKPVGIKNKLRHSFLAALIWALNFFKNKRNFESQAVNWIFFLHSIHAKCKFINKIIKQILIHDLVRISKNIDPIIKKNTCELISIFFTLKYLRLDQRGIYKKFVTYFNKLSKSDKDIYEGDKSLQNNIKKCNYDELSDECIAYLILDLAKSNKILSKIKNRFEQYYKLLNTHNLKTLEQQDKPDLNTLDYHVTHVILIYGNYGFIKKKRKLTNIVKESEQYLIKHTNRILKSRDTDLIGETLECMNIMNNKKWIKKHSTKFLKTILKSQNKNGSFYKKSDKTIYDKFHGIWTSLTAYNDFL